MIDLRCTRVWKCYHLSMPPAGGDRAGWRRRLRVRRRTFWAVRDVTLELAHGEALGIIGPNGAGKSTLLKLLSSVTSPTRGEITYRGRLSALIEVGSGFHPELTGRENVYLSGSILGMRRREIQAKLDAIVEFAGVHEFFDVPVKWYSSGMYVRLGFSVAAHLEPDILLVDEVLAVGDAAFQTRCLDRIRSLKRAGTTILFVSHDLASVQRLCDRVLLMERGRVVLGGAPAEVVSSYLRTATDLPRIAAPPTAVVPGRPLVEIGRIGFDADEGPNAAVLRTGDPLAVRLEYVAHGFLPDAVFEIFFYSQDGRVLQCQATTAVSGDRLDVRPGTYVVEFRHETLGLQPGIYTLGASVKQRSAPETVDWCYGAATLHVEPGRMVRGLFYMPSRWRMAPAQRPGPSAEQDRAARARREA